MTVTRCECGQYPDVCARYGHAAKADTANRIEVLIHLNVAFPTADYDEAERLAEQYITDHGIADDVALVDPQ